MNDNLIQTIDDINLDELLFNIKNNIINITNALNKGKTIQADKYLNTINNLIINYATGDPIDMFNGNATNSLNNLIKKNNNKPKTNIKDVIEQNRIKHLNKLSNNLN